MDYLFTKDFIQKKLPALLAGKRKLFALFASYNQIGHLDNGPFDTNEPDLQVFIQSGGNSYSVEATWNAMSYLFSTNPNSLAHGLRAEELMEKEASSSQTKLEQMVEQNLTPPEDSDLLFIVYVGYSAFARACEYLAKLRTQYPTAMIVATSCDCDDQLKETRFRELVGEKVINDYYINKECSGINSMREIVYALIEQWPNRNMLV